MALADQTGEYASMSERSKLIATYAICVSIACMRVGIVRRRGAFTN